jgi:hypothetical protein
MSDDTPPALIAHIIGEWSRLRPMLDAQPPRGVWILAHEPIAPDDSEDISTPIARAWYGSTDGLHERSVDSVVRLRANHKAWGGTPYHRWGWVDFARLVDEPVYYVTFVWGGRHGYGLQAAVTARGLVLTSSYLWCS